MPRGRPAGVQGRNRSSSASWRGFPQFSGTDGGFVGDHMQSLGVRSRRADRSDGPGSRRPVSGPGGTGAVEVPSFLSTKVRSTSSAPFLSRSRGGAGTGSGAGRCPLVVQRGDPTSTAPQDGACQPWSRFPQYGLHSMLWRGPSCGPGPAGAAWLPVSVSVTVVSARRAVCARYSSTNRCVQASRRSPSAVGSAARSRRKVSSDRGESAPADQCPR